MDRRVSKLTPGMTSRATAAMTMLMSCVRAIVPRSSRTSALASAASRTSLAAPTAPSVRSLATWISSQRTRVPAWSTTAESMNVVMASV